LDWKLWQPGDIAFSVPDSLVVTLERVLGNETVGMLHLSYIESVHISLSNFVFVACFLVE